MQYSVPYVDLKGTLRRDSATLDQLVHGFQDTPKGDCTSRIYCEIWKLIRGCRAEFFDPCRRSVLVWLCRAPSDVSP